MPTLRVGSGKIITFPTPRHNAFAPICLLTFSHHDMSLPALRISNAKAFSALPPRSVGVFVGGTAGIGQAMAESFASSTKESTLVIVGRNRASAEKLFTSLRESGSDGNYEFVECDATLMKNVKQAAGEILLKHPRINYLVFSQGYLTLDGYTPTPEGIDKKLPLNYYSRFRFVRDLLPALRRGQEEDGVGKVMSVLGPGWGGPIDGFMDDLGLKEHYSSTNAKNATATYNDLMMEKFASENPKLSFIHIFPGGVGTNMLSSSNNTLLSIAGKILTPVLRLFLTSPPDCAQYMWHAMHSCNGGAFRSGSKGEDLGKLRYFGNREQMEKLWEHSKVATDVD